MPDSIGTRIKANQSQLRSDQGSINESYTRDLGMLKLVTDSFTFNPATGVTGIIGDFTNANFAVGDPIFVAGTNLNNGYFTIVSIAGNGSNIVVDPPPKAEGPIMATIRTD